MRVSTDLNLRQRRKAAGLTKIRFAELIGVSVATYNLWEAGAGNPNPINLRKLKKALNRLEQEANNRTGYTHEDGTSSNKETK